MLTIKQYIEGLPPERANVIQKLRKEIKSNLPKGFVETMSYNMIGYVVPHSIFPDGYHCDPSLPLPFMNIASQKNFIAVYHMGIYAIPHLMEWFVDEYQKLSDAKLDMGKSCIRFKKLETIPYELIGKLSSKLTAQEWIEVYEKNVKHRKRNNLGAD